MTDLPTTFFVVLLRLCSFKPVKSNSSFSLPLTSSECEWLPIRIKRDAPETLLPKQNPLARKWYLIISCGDYSSEMRKNTLSYPVKADNETTTFRALIGVLHVVLTPDWKIRLFPSWKSFWSPNLFWYLDSQTWQVSSSSLAWVQNGRLV